MEFNKVNINDPQELANLCAMNAITKVGIKEESIKDFVEWVSLNTELKRDFNVYLIKGKFLNETYKLEGLNAYQDELNFVCIKSSDIEDIQEISSARFSIGAKWLEDIIYNNQ